MGSICFSSSRNLISSDSGDYLRSAPRWAIITYRPLKTRNAYILHVMTKNTDLISLLESGPSRPLCDSDRKILRSAIERILVNEVILNEHIHEIVSSKKLPPLNNVPEDDAITEAILERGIAGIDDDTVISILLNPVGLFCLFEKIFDLVPDAWVEVIVRDGKMLAREHRLSPPLIQELEHLDRRGLGNQLRLTSEPRNV